jgi:F-type H+-transporting ATPase subunit delta
MVDSRVARRYAKALFGVAKNLDIVRGVEDDLNSIVSLLQSDANMRHFLIAPYTSRDEKIAIVEKMFADRTTALTLQVMRTMLEKGRESEIEPLRDEFIAMRRQDAGIVYATVQSATTLDEAQKQSIVAAFGKSLGKVVEADFRVDPSLIGGVRVTYENYVLDGSARGTLNKMRERLRYDLLKQV